MATSLRGGKNGVSKSKAENYPKRTSVISVPHHILIFIYNRYKFTATKLMAMLQASLNYSFSPPRKSI
jgi:hypothetical protein